MDFFNAFFKRYWSLVLNCILLLALICTTCYILMEEDSNEVVKTEVLSSHVEEAVADKVYVDVKGAVKKPGVYEMDANSIINDVIVSAGGFTSKAYKNNINLSKMIGNEMVIYVYTKAEYQKLNKTTQVEQVTCNCEDYVIDSCTNEGSSVITPNESTSSSTNDSVKDTTTSTEEIKTDTKVSLNKATKEELMTLNGIGEAKALDIIEYRNKNGGFKTIDEIKNVSGIGDKAYEKIKDYITI